MKRAYKYKLKPTMRQQQMLLQHFGCCRFIYNWGLDRKKNAWTNEKKSIGYLQLARELTLLKNDSEHGWLKDVANESLQQSLRNLDNAYTQFFKAKKGFPKFKSKKHSKNVCKFINNVRFDFDKWKVRIPKMGWTKLCHNKAFDLSKCKIGTLTVSQDKCGDYWCVIIVEDGEKPKPKAKISEKTAVGIDLGIKDFAILSDGTKYGNNKFLENGQKKLKRLQRHFSKAQKGSRRRERLRIKIARQYRRISNRRSDFLHKLTTDITSNFDTICLENLNVQGMMQNHHLANAISSVAWNEFVRQLAYKAEWNGKNLISIGRFEPSSKTCSCCGYVKKDLTLKDRSWVCPKCGVSHDRDINAAINIRNFGLHPQALVAIENKIPEVTGINTDDEGNVVRHPMKRQDNKPCETVTG